jgi:hypothetical protein
MRRLLVSALWLLLAFAGSAVSQSGSSGWPAEKCARYRLAWTEALKRFGREGLGAEFLSRHQAFIDGGCTARADICPRSRAELDMANTMTLRALNAGMSGTFLPFACRGP